MDISQFKASINRRGILLKNKFLMVIQPPKGLTAKFKDFRDITLRASDVSFPTAALQTYDGHFRYGYGVPEKIPFGATFEDTTAHFLVSRDAVEVGLFNQWMNLIMNTDTSKGVWTEGSEKQGAFELSYKSEYATTITIFVYNEEQDKVIEITLYDAYPHRTNIDNLSWQNSSTPMVLSVNIIFKNYVMKTVSKLPDIT